MRLDKLG